MGRLIDTDKITYQKNNHKGEIGYHFVMKNEIDNAPTVEAIPKDQYETRLKADMAAMLEEIQLELDEMKITKVRSAGFAPYSKDPFRRGVNCSKEIIQDKINSLKEIVDGDGK